MTSSRRDAAPPPAEPGVASLDDPLHQLVVMPGVIAHEVRNPLAAARAGLQLAMESVGKMADIGADRRLELLGELGDVGEAVDRALEFLRALSERARGVERSRGRFDAVQAVRSCIELERRLLGPRGVALEFESALPATYLEGDPTLLYQVLLNLVANAVHASAAKPAPIRVSLEREVGGDALRLSVRDQGMGIPAHLHTRIFEPGYTTKVEGTGTGLAVVRTVTEQEFRGTVRVESAPGAGAMFIVTLPAPPQRAPRGAGAAEHAAGPV